MSKGVNMMDLLNPPKPDGHQVISHEVGYATVYCPVAKDRVTADYTSAGLRCNHCGKKIN